MDTPVLTATIERITDDSLLDVYMQRACDSYVGWYKGTPDQASLVSQYQKELSYQRQYLIIRLDGEIIGYSVPRPANSKDLKFAGLPETTEGYWRIGTWFIVKQHRGRGYGKRVMRAFMISHPKIIYAYEEGNHASQSIAISSGLNYAKTYYKALNAPRISFTQRSANDIIFHMYRN